MECHVLTVFPQLYRPFLRDGQLARGVKEGLLELDVWSLRRFTPDEYGQVDDRVYGGRFGMLMKPEPYFRGVEHIRRTRGDAPVTLLAPDGDPFDHRAARRLSKRERIIMLTGRYEGIDHRVREHLADEIVSIGPYVTPGGDLPALVVISAVARQLPGVVSNPTSVERDSYERGRLAPPHYTRPAEFRGHEVPEVLRSGDHERVRAWRREKALERTRRHRPGLIDDPTSRPHGRNHDATGSDRP